MYWFMVVFEVGDSGIVGVIPGRSLVVAVVVWLSSVAAGNNLLPMYWSSLKSRMYGVGRIASQNCIPS